MKELIYSVELPDYIRQVKMADKRQPKYYEPGAKHIPKKYSDPRKFVFQKWKPTGKTHLIEIATGLRVISNPRSAGTPRWVQINNQYIYSGNIHPATRGKLIEAIKESYVDYSEVVNLPPITTFPIIIEAEVHDLIYDPQIRHQLWDVDNRFTPYGKTWSDILQDLDIIPEDHCLYVTGPPSALFFPIKEGEQRKLVFHFYHDQRPLLQEFDIAVWKKKE